MAYDAHLAVNSSKFAAISAGDYGGVFCGVKYTDGHRTELALSETSFANTRAFSGGAIYWTPDSANITATTVHNSSATSAGGFWAGVLEPGAARRARADTRPSTRSERCVH